MDSITNLAPPGAIGDAPASPPMLPDQAPPRLPADLALILSEPCDQIVAAWARAQLNIRNPAKNRLVRVTGRKSGVSYTYSYTTLDKCLDAVRVPLAREGIVLTQVPGSNSLTTLLIHSSGQWLRAKVPLFLDPESVGPQAYGSALTSAKRLSVMAVGGIAGDDDDDGAAASGLESVPMEDVRRQIVENVASETAHPLLEMARSASDIRAAEELMQSWLRWQPKVAPLRDSSSPDGTQVWASLVGEISGALQRLLGKPIAAAWKSLIMATEAAHIEAIAERWDNAWALELRRLKADVPAIYELLEQHRKGVTQRLVRRHADRHALDDERAALQQGAAAATMEAAQQPDGGDEPVFVAPMLDEHGNIASEHYADPITWATDFRRRFEALRDPEAQRSLLQHNEEAVEAACQFAGALALLDNLEPTAASPAPDTHQEAYHVPLPVDRSGVPDLLAYLAALEASLGTVTGVSAMAAWEEANAPTYKADPSIGSRTQMKILQLVAQRKRALGIALPSPKAS